MIQQFYYGSSWHWPLPYLPRVMLSYNMLRKIKTAWKMRPSKDRAALRSVIPLSISRAFAECIYIQNNYFVSHPNDNINIPLWDITLR